MVVVRIVSVVLVVASFSAIGWATWRERRRRREEDARDRSWCSVATLNLQLSTDDAPSVDEYIASGAHAQDVAAMLQRLFEKPPDLAWPGLRNATPGHPAKTGFEPRERLRLIQGGRRD